MANPFDQFDKPTGQGGPAPENPFDQFDEAPQSQGFGEWLADQGSFLGKRAFNAAASLPGLPQDMAAMAARNLPAAATNGLGVFGGMIGLERARQAAEGADSMVPLGSENIRAAIKDYSGGLLTPRDPRNRAEEYGGAVADFLGASAVPGGLIASTSKAPLRVLAGETLASLSGGVGQEAARDIAPDNPYAPVIGGILGSFAPSVAVPALRSALTGKAGRLGETAQTAQVFRDAGVDPMVSQVAPRSGAGRIIERGLSLIPGSSAALSDRVIKQAEAAARHVRSTLDQVLGVGVKSTEATAGRAISEGIGQFINRFKATSSRLYDDLDKQISPAQMVGASNFETSLQKIMGRGNLTPEFQDLLQSPLIAKMSEKFNAATAAGRTIMGQSVLPYQTLKELRTFIGSKLDDVGQLSDIPKGDLKQLYGALSDDLKGAAMSSGPRAQRAFYRADRYYKAGRTRIDDTLEPIRRNRLDAEVFNALMQKDATRVRKVMSSLTRDQANLVAAEIFENMGRAKSGQQTAAGDVFSFDTFLTNYDKLRGDRMDGALFGGSPQLRQAMERLAKVSTATRQASKFLPNQSGTAQGILQYGAAGTVGMAMLAGDVATAGKMTLLAYVGPYISAKALTNPKFVNWLADAGSVPIQRAPSHIARLSVIAKDDPDTVAEFLNAMDQAPTEETQR